MELLVCDCLFFVVTWICIGVYCFNANSSGFYCDFFCFVILLSCLWI